MEKEEEISKNSEEESDLEEEIDEIEEEIDNSKLQEFLQSGNFKITPTLKQTPPITTLEGIVPKTPRKKTSDEEEKEIDYLPKSSDKKYEENTQKKYESIPENLIQHKENDPRDTMFIDPAQQWSTNKKSERPHFINEPKNDSEFLQEDKDKKYETR